MQGLTGPKARGADAVFRRYNSFSEAIAQLIQERERGLRVSRTKLPALNLGMMKLDFGHLGGVVIDENHGIGSDIPSAQDTADRIRFASPALFYREQTLAADM